jgi:hypothetical protein
MEVSSNLHNFLSTTRDMLALARNRVLGFESEYQNVVNKLSQNEINIQGAIDLRSKFIGNQEKTAILEAELFKRRVEVLEHRLELVQLNLTIDKYTLDSCYEDLQLQQLVSATQQITGRENIMRGGANQLIQQLQASILSRQDLMSESKSLLSRLEQLIRDHKSCCEMNEAAQTQLLTQLADNLANNYQKSVMILRKVIEDSLVLRHNARLAADLLATRHIKEERRESDIISSLTQFQHHYEKELNNVEDNYKKEFDIKLQLKRSEVMRLESVLENLLTTITDLKLRSKDTFDKYGNTKKGIDYNYDLLQIRRREELVKRKAELDGLKNALQTAESIVLNPVKTYYISGMRQTSDLPQTFDSPEKQSTKFKKVPNISAQAERVALLTLQSRMKGLKYSIESYSASHEG